MNHRAVAERACSERARALKHDLGKAVAWLSSNLEDATWSGPVSPELVDALCRDLLMTRKGPRGSESCWQVWARLTADWSRPLVADELRQVERALERLARHAPALERRDYAQIAQFRSEIRQAQLEIRAGLAAWQRRVCGA